jgi:hypothetical protein
MKISTGKMFDSILCKFLHGKTIIIKLLQFLGLTVGSFICDVALGRSITDGYFSQFLFEHMIDLIIVRNSNIIVSFILRHTANILSISILNIYKLDNDGMGYK